jgi:hypothetical protein
MLSNQNNFGYSLPSFGVQQQSVAFPSPNTVGNGLIVVGCMASLSRNPNLAISDSKGNTYLPVGGCGIYVGLWTLLVNAWYLQSCAAGANTVTLAFTQAGAELQSIVALSILEYPGTFGALDVSTFTSGLSQKQMDMNVMTTAVDLLFAFGVCFGPTGILNTDSSSTGWTQEESEMTGGYLPPLGLLAVDKVANRGPQSIVVDVGPSSYGIADSSGDVGLLMALPVVWTPPPGPPAPPPPPTPPVSGSAAGWPTIF